jgi:hypothetical protein
MPQTRTLPPEYHRINVIVCVEIFELLGSGTSNKVRF